MIDRTRRVVAATLVSAIALGDPPRAQEHVPEQDVPCETGPRPGASMDTKGVEFGPWIRRFMSRVRRQLDVHPDYSSTIGCAVLAFKVHRDGTISDVIVKNPSSTPTLSETSRRALVAASPVEPLPSGFSDEFVSITSTFYYNMSPTQAEPQPARPTP